MKYLLSLSLIAFILSLSACNKNSNSNVNTEAEAKRVTSKQLYQAILDNDIQLVKQIIQKGFNVNDKIYISEGELTPLLTAIIYKRDVIAEYLVSQKASLNVYYNSYSLVDYVYHQYSPKDSIFTLVKLNALNQGGVK